MGRWTAATAVAALIAVLAACTPAESPGTDAVGAPRVIAGGGTTGIYYGYGDELARVLSTQLDVPFEVAETDGSVDNLTRIADGDALMGLTAADAATDAVRGHPPFRSELPVRAIASIYDDVMHLVTAGDSPIQQVGDLRGRTISMGAPGSGTALIARRLLAAAELSPTDLDDVGLGIDASIDALRDGEIDAFFWSGGLPTPGVERLSTDMDIQLVPMGELVDAVRDTHGPAYRSAIVPQGTYGSTVSVATMAVPNYLVTHTDSDPELVAAVVRLLFEHRVDMASQVPTVGLLDHRRAIFTGAVDLHDGALDYYRSAKLGVGDDEIVDPDR